MADELRLTLLGKPQATLGSTLVTDFIYRKSLALLCYLAVTGRPHSREALIGLLWPEATEASARASLRKTLADLRKRLAPHLIITHREVALNRDVPCWLDVEAFEACVGASTPGRDIKRLQEAVEFYQADFLEGFYVRNAFEFEEWVTAQRGRLRELALQALHSLATHFTDQGEAGRAPAMDYTTRLLALEPWREEAHRGMMRLLALTGQRGAALAQYEVCRQVLAEELGVEPGTETTALYEQIRDGELRPAEIVSAPAFPRTSTLDFLQAQETTPIPERSMFVAREDELAQLDRLLERALAGQGRVAFVIGEPGSGKTVLVREFVRRAMAREPDLVAARGSCNAYGGIGDPYLPFREILALLTGDIEARWRAGAISHEHAGRLWALLPHSAQALLEVGPDLLDIFVSGSALRNRAAMALHGGATWLTRLERLLAQREVGQAQANLEQADLFEMYTNVLQSVAQRSPIILVLDDLQWADAGSISLLFHLGRRLAGQRILVVGIYRPGDVALGRDGKRHPLEPVLHEFQRLFGDMPVDLGQANGKHFVESMLNAETNCLSPAFREALFQHTRGHALFTVEIVKGMQERGDLVQDEQGCWVEGLAVDWENLPARIEGVIAEHLARLPSALQETLKVASVEGEFFTGEVVAWVQGLDQSEIIQRLSGELGRKHRLVESRGSQRLRNSLLSHYRFQHILFQKYLYNSLDEVERTFLHETVGNELEGLYEGQTEEVAVHLARHFQSAGILEKAMGYWQQAGDVAARAYASAEAIAHYNQALELAKQMAMGGEALNRLYTRLGRTLELDSQFEQALVTYEDMERVAHQHGDRSLELASLMARVTIQAVETLVHDPVRAQALGEQALVLARELGDQAAEAKSLWNLSLAYYYGNRLVRAIEYGERSLALARERNLREQMAQTLNDLGSICYIYSGRIKRAKEALHEASLLWRELGNLPMLADSLASSAVAHVFAGEFDQAIAFSEEAYQIGHSIDNLWAQSYSRWKVGLVYWERGEWSQAISVMEESIRLAELAGFPPPQANTRAELAALYGDLGAVERGLETARLALSVAETQNPVQRSFTLSILTRLQLLNGDVADAKATIEEAKNDPYRNSGRGFFDTVTIAEAELGLKLGELRQALAVTDALLTDLRQYGMRVHKAYALYLQGRALWGLGQGESARDRFLEACAEAEAIGSRRTLWRILYALSQLEAEPIEAERLHQGARRVIEYIADHIDQAELRESFLKLPDVQVVLEPVEVR